MYFKTDGGVWYNGEPNRRTLNALKGKWNDPLILRCLTGLLAFAVVTVTILVECILPFKGESQLTILQILAPFYALMLPPCAILLIGHIRSPLQLQLVVKSLDVRLIYLAKATKLKLETLSQDPACRTLVNEYLDDTQHAAAMIDMHTKLRGGDDKLMGLEEQQLHAELYASAKQTAAWAQAEIGKIQLGVTGSLRASSLPA